MDLFTAINQRQSCRDFLEEPVAREDIEKIIQAGIAAPSPLNSQPWYFYVISGNELKEKLCRDAEKYKKEIVAKSQWKWLEQYPVEIIEKAPVVIVVTGDQTKSGADTFSSDGPAAYQHACAAAIQNMLLAVHAMELGGLWYTLFDREPVKKLLKLDDNQIPLAFVCIGKPWKKTAKTPRKPITKKTVYLTRSRRHQ